MPSTRGTACRALLAIAGVLLATGAIAAPIRDQKAFSDCLETARMKYTADQVTCHGRPLATVTTCLYQASIDYGSAISACKVADEQSTSAEIFRPSRKGDRRNR
jgi:hypothetical protein